MYSYKFCVKWILEQSHNKNLRVLDYGCGAGQIVTELRKKSIDAYGCDIFYDGGDCSKFIDPSLLNTIIKKMDTDTIPFDTESFDIVINNQVLEHVEDFNIVLPEIKRVLKPGGVVLSLFPDNRIWREGHCGIPFLHWFPKNSHLRIYYAGILRFFGLGFHKNNKKILTWSRDFCEWLDTWVHYKSRSQILSSYNKYFLDIQFIEEEWLYHRFKNRLKWVLWFPKWIQRLVVRKLAGLVFIAHKVGEKKESSIVYQVEQVQKINQSL